MSVTQTIPSRHGSPTRELMAGLLRVLDRRLTVTTLFVLNVLVASGMLVAMWDARGPDWPTYHGLAEGLLHGRYSFWWEYEPYRPDTFRSPGYPLMAAAMIATTGSWYGLKVVQFALYVVGVWLAVRTITRLGGSIAARSLFLLLLLPSANLPYYVPLLFPEIPVFFGVSLAAWIWTAPRLTARHGVALGLAYALVFQCRPVFLLFPAVAVLADAVARRARWPRAAHLVAAVVFALTLLPYGMWNQRHHGTFSVTPLEGGGGVFHTGYWAGRLPGYTERRYWGNTMADEVVRFVPAEQVPAEIAAFNREWDAIDRQLAPWRTPADEEMSVLRAHRPELFATWSSGYTQQRERLLKAATVRNIGKHPIYYAAYKVYSAVRLWVVGIMRPDFAAASASRRLVLLYPTLLTLGQLLLALLVVPWALRTRGAWRRVHLLVLLPVYWTVMHVPFVIQSRYTIPVRGLLLMLTAVALAAMLERRAAADEAGPITAPRAG